MNYLNINAYDNNNKPIINVNPLNDSGFSLLTNSEYFINIPVQECSSN